MPGTRSRQREIERDRGRRRGRRRRKLAAAIVILIALGGATGLIYSGGGGRPRLQTTPAPRSATTASPGAAARATLPTGLRPLAARLGRVVEGRSRLEERAALDFFATRGQPLYCGGTSGRYVALTFDDGPGRYTGLVLRILERAHFKATFFLVGRNVGPRTEQAGAEAQSSAAFGIHTWSHPVLTKLERAQIVRQIVRTRGAIFEATGERPPLFRPPYGDRDALVDSVARQLGLVEVLWSIDSGDSQGKNWLGIGREVLKNVVPGSIILMHDNRGQTVRALKYVILPGLKKRGFIPVTIPELLVLDPPPLGGSPLRCWQHWHPY
ncbi:MAG: polysaccharide deacetylase family protein [Gaiellaceae bacterium]